MSHWNETYDALAGCYDDMTEDVNYPGWADFGKALFPGKAPSTYGIGLGLWHRNHVFFAGRPGI